MDNRHPHLRPTVLAGVAVGTAVGSVLRWVALSIAATPAATPKVGSFPVVTLTVNLTGTLLLATLAALAARWKRPLPPAISAGLLGGYTTMSTFVLEVLALVETGHAGTALEYLAATLVVGLSGAWFILWQLRPQFEEWHR